MGLKMNRVGRILLAVLTLALVFAVGPGQAAAEGRITIGYIENGVWRLDPANYTYRTLQNTKELDLSGKGITAIEGIEYLGGLTKLDLSYNELENLDLSACTRLVEFNCSHNRLGSLAIGSGSRMKVLDCSENPLGEVNVSAMPNLQTLNCSNCGLKSLDIGVNRSLTELYCAGNALSAISVGHLKRLKVLNVAETGIAELDVSANDKLTILDCSGNPELKELNLKANRRIRELYTHGTAISSLDLSGLADLFSSKNGYGYEYSDEARIWRLEDGALTATPGATIRIGAEIVIPPTGDDLTSRGIALPGYLQFKPGDFTNHLLSSSYDEMCHYFRMTVGPDGSIFRKTEEGWYYENAHTVVRKAGIAVQSRMYETEKVTRTARAFTVFNEDGSFRYCCTLEYMPNEDAVEFVKRMTQDHEEAPDTGDLRGYTGQVQFFACRNALIIMEGIPSAAYEKTPTLESYIASDPARPLYLIE